MVDIAVEVAGYLLEITNLKGKYSARTITAFKSDLDSFSNICPTIEGVSQETIKRYLSDSTSVSLMRRRRSSLVGFLRYVREKGFIEDNESIKINEVLTNILSDYNSPPVFNPDLVEKILNLSYKMFIDDGKCFHYLAFSFVLLGIRITNLENVAYLPQNDCISDFEVNGYQIRGTKYIDVNKLIRVSKYTVNTKNTIKKILHYSPAKYQQNINEVKGELNSQFTYSDLRRLALLEMIYRYGYDYLHAVSGISEAYINQMRKTT